MILACGWALVAAGCGSGTSPLPDAGTGGKVTGFGGNGNGGTTGTGGALDSGVNVCADASAEGGATDSDGDGFPDCVDLCPADFYKQKPGICGCGLFDTDDADGDGTPDCIDKCPGIPDVDTDHDGTLDCLDGCPQDPNRTVSGACGCGVPENTPFCLVHRYSFDDTTSTIADSITIPGISPANGTATGTVPANGRITLAGGGSTAIGGSFVTLPANTISKLGINATFEAWVIWTPVAPNTNGAWQRIFDFGNSNQAAGTPGTGQTYLFLSPSNGVNQRLRAAITLTSNGGEDVTDGTGSLSASTATPVQVALVVNGAAKTMTLYFNGVANGTPVTLKDTSRLTSLNDVNNWLGRSQWAADQLFAGSIHEFRIYGAALTDAQILASFGAGPDRLPDTPDGGAADGGAADATPDGGAGDTPSDTPSGQ